MLLVRLVKTVVAIRPTFEQAKRNQLSQLVLDGVKSKTAQIHQFPHVVRPWRRRKEQP